MADTRILVFAGSIRTGAYSGKLAAAAAKELAVAGADVTLVSLGDYPLPIYNADIEHHEGFPDNAKRFARLIEASQGIFIATPEYNHSLPPLLKNTIDWTSRPKLAAEIKVRGKVFAIGSSSDGLIGGARALLDLRKVLNTAYGAITIPEQISMSKSGQAYDEHGNFAEEPPQKLMTTIARRLIEVAGETRTMTVGKPLRPRDRLMVALDVPTVAEAEAMVRTLRDSVGFFKIGLQLVFAGGLAFAEELSKEGRNVFLDVKLLDIGNTVGKAVESIAALGVRLATVHAYPQAMRAAVVARAHSPLGLLGVTVLTSMDQDDFAAAGYAGNITDRVVARAIAAMETGMDGVVASPSEIVAVRKAVGRGLAIVTPGIRPKGGDVGDQKRIATAEEAIAAGADYLVVGRPITAASDPRSAAEALADEIAAGMERRA